MGQCYTVEAKLDFNNKADEESFCRIIREEVEVRNGISANFGPVGNMTTVFDCFKAVTIPGAVMYGDVMTADFSASYGWEEVMVEIFYHAARRLSDGSYIEIYPDDGMHRITVSEGRVSLLQSYDTDLPPYEASSYEKEGGL